MKKFMKFFMVLMTLLILVTFKTLGLEKSKNEVKAEGMVIQSEDFSGSTSIFGENVIISNGVGVWNTTNFFESTLPTPLVESNNYEFSFDMKITSNGAFNAYFHIIGLDGTNNQNIALHFVGLDQKNVPYLRLFTTATGHDIYNNSGDNQGGIDWHGVDFSNFVNVKFVVFEKCIELWIDNKLKIVSSLDNFGNNNYNIGRVKLEKGIVRAFGFHISETSSIEIDNYLVKEAVSAEKKYNQSTTVTDVSNENKTLLLPGVQTFYSKNFVFETEYVVGDITKSGYWFIDFYGLNGALLGQQTRKEYTVRVQAHADLTSIKPGVYVQSDDEDWHGKSSENHKTVVNGDVYKIRIEVFGDKIKVFYNDELSVETTFTDLKIPKGTLQYISIKNGGNSYWKEANYYGFENDLTAVIIETKILDSVVAGTDLTLKAKMFGNETTETFDWYVNNVAQNNSSKTLTLNDIPKNNYEVIYKSSSFSSQIVKFEVLEKLITINADKEEIYPNETVEVSANLVGNFTGDEPIWYVNDEQKGSSEKLILTNLTPGIYKVEYNSKTTNSNIITIKVLEPIIEITTVKNIYKKDEIAKITSNLIGMTTTTYDWYVNDELNEAKTEELNLSLNNYEDGKILIIKVKVGEIVSNEINIIIFNDVRAKITSDENYEQISDMTISEGQTYGTYDVKTESGKTFITGKNEANGDYCDYSGKMPSDAHFVFKYELLIPEEISKTYYLYPVLFGLLSTSPEAGVEVAMSVTSTKISPYIKNQKNGKVYGISDHGLGVDLNYGTLVKKGEWNTVEIVVYGGFLGYYINNEMVLLLPNDNLFAPSKLSICVYPDGGSGIVPLKMANFTMSTKQEKAPAVEAVNISLSSIKIKVGEKINVNATLVPYNAEAKEISWYINDIKVDGANTLQYTYTANKEGNYTIYCKIDGIKSPTKTFVVLKSEKEIEKGNKKTKWIIIGSSIGIVTLAAIITPIVVIVVKKKKGSK